MYSRRLHVTFSCQKMAAPILYLHKLNLKLVKPLVFAVCIFNMTVYRIM